MARFAAIRAADADATVTRSCVLPATFCPHCSSELPDHDPKAGGRCPSCRLVVGPGRARDRPEDEGRASGVMANAARREHADPVAPEAAFRWLREIAERMGCAVDRLRMTDYDRETRNEPQAPSVAELLSTFDTWKLARAAAANRGPGAPPAVDLPDEDVDVA